MKLIKRLSTIATVLLFLSCAYGQDVHYNYARGTSFQSFKTYQWVDSGDVVADQLIDQSIKRAIDEQLAQKGLTKVEQNGDLLVRYHAGVNLEKGVDLFGTGIRNRGGWDSIDSASVHGQTSTIPVGMILIDLYDSATKQLVWRGDATKTLDLKKDPDKNYKLLQKTMAKLFKNYPPPSAK